jgi:ClpP class serine protease
MDQSEKDTKDGVKYTPIFAGDRKNDLSPHAPLANDAAQELQAEVDRLYTMFVTAVATYRGISAEAIRATQARLYWGRNGINANLADDIGTLTSTLEAMSMPTKIKRLMAEEDEISQQDPEEDKKEVVAEVEEQGICSCCGQPLPPVDATDPIGSVEPTEPAATKAAVEIAQMCQLAGFPNQTASFLASGKSPKQVRNELLRLKAQSQSQGIHSSFTGEARPQQVSPLVTAAQKVASQRMEKRA